MRAQDERLSHSRLFASESSISIQIQGIHGYESKKTTIQCEVIHSYALRAKVSDGNASALDALSQQLFCHSQSLSHSCCNRYTNIAQEERTRPFTWGVHPIHPMFSNLSTAATISLNFQKFPSSCNLCGCPVHGQSLTHSSALLRDDFVLGCSKDGCWAEGRLGAH